MLRRLGRRLSAGWAWRRPLSSLPDTPSFFHLITYLSVTCPFFKGSQPEKRRFFVGGTHPYGGGGLHADPMFGARRGMRKPEGGGESVSSRAPMVELVHRAQVPDTQRNEPPKLRLGTYWNLRRCSFCFCILVVYWTDCNRKPMRSAPLQADWTYFRPCVYQYMTPFFASTRGST